MNRIGNDQVFIEFDGNYQNSNFIPLRLCIEGEYLGTLDSPTYVTSFINSLKNLLNDNYYYSNVINDENCKKFFLS
ncbi:hypothetical protein PT23B2_11910 [Acinetobacter towneri]